ncbi:uncharacterized protein LOC123558130 [Mercenaria mercenaria]|uniref:uncharacterized protein LOC123558130 n=1 Tax=Mercenaria mercenaria TaxID=6596 RepID=UPI001E1DB1B2|nr:uncharacterized protein LOC123558130 [Mercenaria mercenaria]
MGTSRYFSKLITFQISLIYIIISGTMPGPIHPKFRREGGAPALTDTEEGRRIGTQREQWCPPSTTQQIEKDARERVIARQGDVTDQKDVLGEYVMQFGKYRGQNFRWALENVPGYVGWIVNQIIKDEGKEDTSSQHQKNNKAALKNYVLMFEEGKRIVEAKASEPRKRIAWKSLLVGRPLSPEQIRKKYKMLTSPPKFTPNKYYL